MEQSQRPETESDSESFLDGERQGLERAAEAMCFRCQRPAAYSEAQFVDVPAGTEPNGVRAWQHTDHGGSLFPCVSAAIRALLPTGREAAWQSIETAPKDGTEILSIAWFSEIDDWWYAHVKWFLDDWRFCNDGDCSIARPTCWQPLPPPPTTLKQVGAEDDQGK